MPIEVIAGDTLRALVKITNVGTVKGTFDVRGHAELSPGVIVPFYTLPPSGKAFQPQFLLQPQQAQEVSFLIENWASGNPAAYPDQTVFGCHWIMRCLENNLQAEMTDLSVFVHVAAVLAPSAPRNGGSEAQSATQASMLIVWDGCPWAQTYNLLLYSAYNWGYIVTGLTATSFKHNGLYPNTSYRFKVLARGDGISAEGPEATLTTAAYIPPPPPGACSNLQVSNITSTSAKLNWTPPAEPYLAFQLWVNGEIHGDLPKGSHVGIVISPLAAGTEYFMKVRASSAMDVFGSFSNTVRFTTLSLGPRPCGAPVLVPPAESTLLSIIWTPSLDPVARYNIWVRDPITTYWQMVGSTTGWNSYRIGGLEPDTPYTIRVDSCDAQNNCNPSSTSVIRTAPAGQPPGAPPEGQIISVPTSPSIVYPGGEFSATPDVSNKGESQGEFKLTTTLYLAGTSVSVGSLYCTESGAYYGKTYWQGTIAAYGGASVNFHGTNFGGGNPSAFVDGQKFDLKTVLTCLTTGQMAVQTKLNCLTWYKEPPLPPGKPSSVSVSPGEDYAVISWASVSGADHYMVGVSGKGETRAGGTSMTWPGLLPSTGYTATVKACNDHGCSSATSKPFTTLTPPPSPEKPPKPVLYVNLKGPDWVELAWAVAATAGVEAGTCYLSCSDGQSTSKSYTPGATYYTTFRNLQPDTYYTFYAYAKNSAGSSSTASTSTKTTPAE